MKCQYIEAWAKMAQIFFADAILKCILLNEYYCILIQISVKFVPKPPVYSKSALVQEIFWHHTDDKTLAETVLTQFTDTT